MTGREAPAALSKGRWAKIARLSRKPKARGSVIAALGVLVLIIGLWDFTGRTGMNPVVPRAVDAAEQIAVATTVAYVSLRTINAALSAAQEVELGASIGAQASFQPLKVLEPLDDTVERVAAVVFAVAAGASLAIVGLQPVTAIGLVLLGVGLIVMGGAQVAGHGASRGAGLRAVRLGAALGLVLPLAFASGVWLGERATQSQMDAAMAALVGVEQEAEVFLEEGEYGGPDDGEADEGGWFSGIGSAFSSVSDAAQGYGDAFAFKERADEIFEATLTIIGVFLLRMLVLPVLLLWAVMALARRNAW